MRIVLQRVKRASVMVENEVVGAIEKGICLFLGVGKNDDESIMIKAVDKILGLRIYEDESGKINHSVTDIEASILVVSQFTLLGNCKKGRRPDFTAAGDPQKACELYEKFADECERRGMKTARGVFGAHMDVELVNDGPFTLDLEF